MKSDPDCVFCKIVAGQIPALKILEDDSAIAFLDIGPLAAGHVLLVPKNHYVGISEMPADEFALVAGHLPRLGKAVKEVAGAEGFNLLVNEGSVAGQEVPHLHFHLIPRASGDGLGYRWKTGKYEEGEGEALMASYREAL